MMKKMTAISHNNVTYEIRFGSWFQHLHGKASEALREVHTDDIILPTEKTVAIYKAEKRAEYNAQPRSPRSSAKQYLNDCSLSDFGLNWDKLIELLKKRINDACIPLLLKYQHSDNESYELAKAASNGHISAMYRIGASLGGGGVMIVYSGYRWLITEVISGRATKWQCTLQPREITSTLYVA